MPLTWHDSDVLAVRTRLLPGRVLPVWQRPDAHVGSCFFWEQRYWLEAVQVRDQVDFRKLERRRGTIARLLEEFSLAPWHCSFPRESTEAVRTPAFSTAALMGYLLLKRYQTDTPQHAALCERWNDLLDMFRSLLDSLVEGLAAENYPTITIQDVVLRVTWPAIIELQELEQAMPSLRMEYEELRRVSPTLRLPPWPPGARLRVFHFLVFLDGRIRLSAGRVPDTHWLFQARSAVLQVAAFLAELVVYAEVEDQQRLRSRELPSNVLSKSGRLGEHLTLG